MKRQYIVPCLVALGWVDPAFADSFSYDFSEPGSDPAANFDEACVKDDLDAEAQRICDARAAAMEAELVTHLLTLEGDDDPETLALFREAIDLDSPAVRAVAVQYLSRNDNAPSGFLDHVRAFFFGTEPHLGAVAANVLTQSSANDETLGKLYHEQRNAGDYDSVYGANDERLAEACLKDARLDLVSSFSAAEQFAPAERLLMYDRFAVDFSDATVDYPLTAFVTDEPFNDVSKHFTKVFGKKPYRPLSESQAELNAVTEQLIELQLDAVNGDQAAIRKVQELGDQMSELQEAVALGGRLQLEYLRAPNDVFWVETPHNDVLGPLPRAVSIGEDELLGRVVIRYLSGVTSEHSPDDSPGSESPDGGSNGDDTDDDGETPPDGKPGNGKPGHDRPGDSASSSGDSGCALTTSGQTSGGEWALLAVVFAGLVRRRRTR